MTYWVNQVRWWSSRSLEFWAAHLTALYVGGSILVMAARFDELITLHLNEIGDLLAGVFGPAAFLWLILGYLQQGRELKISSNALLLQADELQASVDQQREIAAATRSQVEHIMQESIEERRRYQGRTNARFVISSLVTKTVFGSHTLSLTLQNRGGTAFDTVVRIQLPEQDIVSSFDAGLIESNRGRVVQMEFEYPQANYHTKLSICHETIDGRAVVDTYDANFILDKLDVVITRQLRLAQEGDDDERADLILRKA